MKVLIFLFLTSLFAAATCTQATMAANENSGSIIQQDISPPAADPADLFEFPNREDGLKGWLNWLLGAAVFIVYELLVRMKPTSKTYSLLGLLYNFLNWFKSDKAKDGNSFKINPG